MSAHSIGSASISFGLVSIPVKLFSTGQPSESISFRMVHKKCGTPLKQQYICPKEEVVVTRDDIAKGYEYAKDQFVLFTNEEIKAVEEEATHAIAITEFLPLDAIDPVYYDKPYYLGPDKGAERAYHLLGEAMKKAKVAGLAQYAARGKAYLVMIRPMEDGLVMQQLRYADEVKPFSEVGVPEAKVKPEELNLALQLMEQNMKKDFHPERFEDTVKKRMQEIIEQKVEGEEVTFAPKAHPKAQVIDLMEALKASLGEGEEEATTVRGKSAGARKPAKASPRGRASSEGGKKRARG
jgi:DNA end-binding protein Ku